ncbi:hypothetical protein ACOI22_14685 [Glaciecola sp. 2405UD65-10]|uniref:hypothetical protein n=1 Tax=Glaciecola sp. 2405UD65-10 TaxID=3397244 RepID=UPI003B59E920
MSNSDDAGPILQMASVKTAIANNEEARLKELLEGQKLDETYKDYLMDLAGMSNANIKETIKNTPSK